MKKTNIKILSLAMSLFLALSTPIGVLADNVTNDSIGSSNMEDKESNVGVDSTQGQETTYSEDITTSKEESTLVYVSQASTFSVVIPKTIILDGKLKNASYEVLVSGNIGGKESVNVVPDSEFVMSQKGKRDIKALVLQDKMSWSYKEFDTKANGSIEASNMTAGSWKGSFNFKIELETTPYVSITVTNTNGEDLNAKVTFITGTNKTTLLNELVDGGFIANENEVNALINVETDDFEDTATTTIDVSNFAEKDDIIAIYHYDETLGEWEYIDTCIVDENGQIVANFNSFSPIAFVKKETNHEHSYTSEMIVEPTCATKGTTKYTCECGYSYTKQNIETIAHNVVNSKCTNCDYDEYVPFTLTPSNINMVGIEASGDMVIPETFEYDGTIYKITQIGIDNPYPDSSKGFYNNTNITSVTLPDSVAVIEKYAFFNCTNLTSVEIPNSVTSIGNQAFDGCTNLTNINVSKENTTFCSIDGILFSKEEHTLIRYPLGKTNTTYTIPSGVTSIEISAFNGCTSLTNVEIPNSVTNIEDYAFYGCTNLESITIPENVTSIGSCAFYNCTSLTSVEIPDSVTSIESNAFYNVSIVIYTGIATGSPWGAKSVKGYIENDFVYEDNTKTILFKYVGDETSITIPSSVTSIDSCAFFNCTNLTSVKIPDSVISIGSCAFYNCTSLTKLEIPDSVTSIESSAFENVPLIIYNGTATGSPWGAKSIN